MSVKWASFTVAVVALVQYWAIALWRRFFRKGTMDVHETGVIEVGFSQFGPTVSLLGTLRTVHHDLFVQRMHLVVTRLRDGAQHRFDWESFRGGGPSGQFTSETPSGFLVSTTQPQRYNVFFSDVDTRADVMRWRQQLSQEWQAKLQEDGPSGRSRGTGRSRSRTRTPSPCD